MLIMFLFPDNDKYKIQIHHFWHPLKKLNEEKRIFTDTFGDSQP